VGVDSYDCLCRRAGLCRRTITNTDSYDSRRKLLQPARRKCEQPHEPPSVPPNPLRVQRLRWNTTCTAGRPGAAESCAAQLSTSSAVFPRREPRLPMRAVGSSRLMSSAPNGSGATSNARRGARGVALKRTWFIFGSPFRHSPLAQVAQYALKAACRVARNKGLLMNCLLARGTPSIHIDVSGLASDHQRTDDQRTTSGRPADDQQTTSGLVAD